MRKNSFFNKSSLNINTQNNNRNYFNRISYNNYSFTNFSECFYCTANRTEWNIDTSAKC